VKERRIDILGLLSLALSSLEGKRGKRELGGSLALPGFGILSRIRIKIRKRLYVRNIG
jgi:hypothetical protein